MVWVLFRFPRLTLLTAQKSAVTSNRLLNNFTFRNTSALRRSRGDLETVEPLIPGGVAVTKLEDGSRPWQGLDGLPVGRGQRICAVENEIVARIGLDPNIQS